ncbi:right-handed parallel beta-helix repeat-containing protein [Desulfobacca acetoxidans]|uniref:Uncharacterized protein n=1 Tax=Desulfobacca acetoxidans (strain ATCC 700848 / DSM 11109 / ASRB2) TaxID=880072 RepID=F2NI33_DESAR|nr:right-handed parallel beta-helix repeat-containing protein [Desulfobacca acetoxidans]AEB09659.1 hypothetical protein Desac_1819 [Desulfobacca acetoxidans DSM 11109]
MGTKDASRSMFDPKKHYTGTWTLQGRLITDFDENDGRSIALEEGRRTRLDIIGAYGSPDDGFRVKNVRSVGGFLEFDLLAGSLYLGGLRLEQEDNQTYNTQRDNLQVTRIPAGGQGRRDLVFLEAYEAPVTAVEDGELLDPAVGVETSARNRRFQRIHVLTNVSAGTCDQAWQLLEKEMKDHKWGVIGQDCRQMVNTRLTVGFTEEGVDDDLCEPPREGGYQYAENQAIRVQLVEGGHKLTWGFDNAAPLYRVSLSADRRKVTLITPPRDRYSTPIVGQVVEILPWGALLANGEKTAGLSGYLTRLTAVDPSDETANAAITLTLANPVPNGFDRWKNRPDASQLAENGIFYYMQIWNRGGDITSPPAIPYTFGTPLVLGTTGLEITLTGDEAMVDDYWIIAARPETPTRVYPWQLESGAAPEGVPRFLAPLALIHWKQNGSIDVTDCRPPFRPLTVREGCCTYCVGDGKNSDGDYNDLDMALEQLGGQGGKICLLPGIHRADVNLVGRRNLTISGCGCCSKLIPKTLNDSPVIKINDCSRIGLGNFEIISVNGSGIAAEQVAGLQIEDMKILAGKIGIDVEDSQDLIIRRTVIRMLDKEGGDVGIYAQGERLAIEECDIQVIPGGKLPEIWTGEDKTPSVNPTDPCLDPSDFYDNLAFLVYYVNWSWSVDTFYLPIDNPYQTLGGIQIGSGAEIVTIHRNTIIGGAGNGITLGSDIADVNLAEFEPPPGGAEEFPEVTLKQDYEIISGKVLLDNEAIGDLTLTFDDGKGFVLPLKVDASGTFYGKLPAGVYSVGIVDSQFGVREIEPLGEGNYGTGLYYIYLEAREERAPRGGEDLLAFIHDVTIDYNRIVNMGFSGIGAPRFTTADIAALSEFSFAMRGKANLQLLYLVYIATGTITGFVVDLTIYRNTITRCLQNVPLTKVDQFAIERALGGISLALCDGVNIEENMIQDCGRDAATPVCGVFLSFSIDVTIRENHILNNGQDRRAEQAIKEYGAVSETEESELPGSISEKRGSYNRYRVTNASGYLAANIPDIDYGRGPRAAILLPICLSANVFAGGAAQEAVASLNAQGLTGAAQGRHAARIDGNYVIHPFGKSLFVGAAGPLSITDNQLISDRALPRSLDALAGGLSGRVAAGFVLGPLDLFASNVMVVDICPGAYLVEQLMLRGLKAESMEAAAQVQPVQIPFGYPDGNILFAGNQIKQGDAGDRPTIVTIATMDDVNFVDNQIDVLNATGIVTTSIILGATARAANNRLKEPPLLALKANLAGMIAEGRVSRFSLLQIGMLAGGMINNQGQYCFKLFGITDRCFESANFGLNTNTMNCGETVIETIPTIYVQILEWLLIASARFALALSKLG